MDLSACTGEVGEQGGIQWDCSQILGEVTALVSVPLVGQGDLFWGFEHPRLDAASALSQKKHLTIASRKCHPKIWSSLLPLPMVIKQHLSTQNILWFCCLPLLLLPQSIRHPCVFPLGPK